MQSITTIIIDDETLAANNLKMILERYCPETSILGMAHSLSEGIRLIQNMHPQLVFLDISLASDETGFDLLDILPQRDFKVIFVTAHPDFTLKAIKHRAFDYILKPIDYRELVKCIQELVTISQPLPTESSAVLLPSVDGTHLIQANDILYCKADGSYTQFYLENNRTLTLSRTLKQAEKLLNSPRFMRIHRSFIINTQKVSKFNLQNGGYVEIRKKMIAVSKTYSKQLNKLFTSNPLVN
jgi:two-component system LytT family response regulator